jgi:FixJ family two-component response regulator
MSFPSPLEKTFAGPVPPPLPSPIVHIVEDDDDVRRATARLLKLAGHHVQTYASAAEFLAQVPAAQPGCVVLDVQLPGESGLDLQDRLARTEDVLPIVFVTGHGNIPMSVRAIKAGAVDFLTKPIPGPVLIAAVGQALRRDADARAARAHAWEVQARYDRLTPREREVFAHLIGGQLNKQVAFDLGTAERTIKAHRHSIMEKLGAESILDLARVAAVLHIEPARAHA